jgi:hypothetical protein
MRGGVVVASGHAEVPRITVYACWFERVCARASVCARVGARARVSVVLHH